MFIMKPDDVFQLTRTAYSCLAYLFLSEPFCIYRGLHLSAIKHSRNMPSAYVSLGESFVQLVYFFKGNNIPYNRRHFQRVFHAYATMLCDPSNYKSGRKCHVCWLPERKSRRGARHGNETKKKLI